MKNFHVLSSILGLVTAAVLMGCQPTGPNPDHPPQPAPGPTVGRHTTPPPIGRQVGCPIIDACKPVTHPVCPVIDACKPVPGLPVRHRVAA